MDTFLLLDQFKWSTHHNIWGCHFKDIRECRVETIWYFSTRSDLSLKMPLSLDLSHIKMVISSVKQLLWDLYNIQKKTMWNDFRMKKGTAEVPSQPWVSFGEGLLQMDMLGAPQLIRPHDSEWLAVPGRSAALTRLRPMTGMTRWLQVISNSPGFVPLHGRSYGPCFLREIIGSLSLEVLIGKDYVWMNFKNWAMRETSHRLLPLWLGQC